MNSTWDIEVESQVGGEGFISYWFTPKIAGRLNLRYCSSASAVSSADLEYTVYDSDYHTTQTFTRDFSESDDEGYIKTFKINPSIQIAFSNDHLKGISVLFGPSIFMDDVEGYLDLPIVWAYSDGYYYHLTSATLIDPVTYKEKKTSIGVTAAVNGRLKVSPTIFLEGSFFVDLGGMPLYDTEKYDLDCASDWPGLETRHIKISNDDESILRDLGFNVGLGFGL